MPYSNTTQNMGLPQYSLNDRPDMDDFNTAFQKIDENYIDARQIAGWNQLSNPNMVIDGEFQIWPEGESVLVTAGTPRYVASQWYFAVSADRTITKGARGITLAPGENMAQPIEVTPNALGKAHTISFDIIAEMPGTLYVTAGNGSNFSWAWLTQFEGATINYNAGAQRVKHTFTVSNISTKILSFQIYQPITSVVIDRVQLEEGSIATPYKSRPLRDELQACQRYYENSADIENLFVLNAATVSGFCFKVRKRIPPNVTIASYNGNANKVTKFGDPSTEITITDVWANVDTVSGMVGTFTAGTTYIVRWTADARIY